MRQLHVVAVSDDGRHVLLAASRNATAPAFRVPLDDRLAAAVRGVLPRPGESTPPSSALSVREIQARLRAGQTVDQVAREAGVPVARVERFAGPVVSERERIVSAARAAVLTRARRGPSARPLGDAVDRHLGDAAGVDAASVRWTTGRQQDGRWIVEVAYNVRGRRKKAGWLFNPTAGELTAVDATSSVLGFVESEATTPSRRVVMAAPPSRSSATRRSGGSATPPRRLASPPSAPSRAAASRSAASADPPNRTAAGTGRPVARDTGRNRAPVAGRATSVEDQTAARRRSGATGGAAVSAAAGRVPSAARSGICSPAGRPQAAVPAASGSSVPTSGRRPAATSHPAATARSATAARPQEPASGAQRGPADPPATASTGPDRQPARRPRRQAATAAEPRRRVAAESAEPPQRPPQLRVVPDPATGRRRASMPAWADVLLSTTPPARPAEPDDGRG